MAVVVVEDAAVVTDVMVAVAAADRLMLVLLSLFDRCICDFVVADVVVAVAGVVVVAVVVAVAVLVVVAVVVVVALLLLSLIRLLVIVWSTV